MTKINSAFAAALIASATFASAALADEGDFYVGTSEAAAVDTMQTGSIGSHNAQQVSAAVNRGDYYDGANRPN